MTLIPEGCAATGADVALGGEVYREAIQTVALWEPELRAEVATLVAALPAPYFHWSSRSDSQVWPYNDCSPNIVQSLLPYMERTWGGRSLGCHNDRYVAGSHTWSTHAWGGAVDYLPDGGNAVLMSAVAPFLIAHAQELGINTIHDYVRQQMWKPGVGWVRASIGTPGGQWGHIEVTPLAFLDARPVEQKLGTLPPPPPGPGPIPITPQPLEDEDMPSFLIKANDGSDQQRFMTFWWDGTRIGWVRSQAQIDVGLFVGLYKAGAGGPLTNFTAQEIQGIIDAGWSGGPVPPGFTAPTSVDSGVT